MEKMHEAIEGMLAVLPDFIDDQYPKGNKERGPATVAIVLYLEWCKQQLKFYKLDGKDI